MWTDQIGNLPWFWWAIGTNNLYKNNQPSDVLGGFGEGLCHSLRRCFQIFDKTIYSKALKLSVTLRSFSAEILIRQLCVCHFLRCHGNAVALAKNQLSGHNSLIFSSYIHFISIFWLDFKLIFVSQNSKIQDGGSNDVITSQKWYQLLEQAQGYLIISNLSNCALTNFLKHSSKYSGAMLSSNLSHEAKTAQSLSDFKHELASSSSRLPCLLLDCTDSMYYNFYLKSLINYLKYISTLL